MIRLVFISCCLALIAARDFDQVLNISNPYHDAGYWGPVELCEEDSFAAAVEVKYQSPDHLDETAVNGVKLYCSTEDGKNTGYVTSTVRKHGKWYGMQICSSDFITGFRANVLEYQGTFTDDVAVENLQVECDYGKEIVDGIPIPVPAEEPTPYNFKPGVWSSFANCSKNSAVCGIQTRYEDVSIGDEVAIADFILFCCSRTSSNMTIPLGL